MKGFIDFLREMMEHHESLTGAVKIGAAAYGISRIVVLALNASMQSLKVTMATMPWGAIAIAISAVAFKIMSAVEATKTFEKFQKELSDTTDRLTTAVMGEEIALR